MDAYRNAHWPTRDGVIPIKLFFELLQAIANVSAAEELQQYYATLLAMAQVWGDKDSQGERMRALKALRATAYPRLPQTPKP